MAVIVRPNGTRGQGHSAHIWPEFSVVSGPDIGHPANNLGGIFVELRFAQALWPGTPRHIYLGWDICYLRFLGIRCLRCCYLVQWAPEQAAKLPNIDVNQGMSWARTERIMFELFCPSRWWLIMDRGKIAFIDYSHYLASHAIYGQSLTFYKNGTWARSLQ